MESLAHNENASQTLRNMALTLVLALIFTACLVGASGIAAPDKAYAASTTTVKITGTENYNQAKQVYKKVNSQRSKAHKGTLKVDKKLEKAAMRRAAELALYYSHTRPNGKKCYTTLPSSYKTCGENIAAGYKNANAVMKGWMNSPKHKANILNKKYKSIGIGCFTVNGITYWVQLFAGNKASSYSWQSNKTISYSIPVASSKMGKLSLKPSGSGSLKVGKTRTYKLYMTNKGWSYAKTPIDNATYRSSNKTVASIKNAGGSKTYGYVKGVKAGTTKITGKIGFKSASASLTVKK